MKLLLILAALMLAMTSIAAEASLSRAGMDQAAAAAGANLSPPSPDCHDAANHTGAGAALDCAFPAHCALLCGVAPPTGPESAFVAQFVAVKFFASAEHPAGSRHKPEAPPPRPVVL